MPLPRKNWEAKIQKWAQFGVLGPITFGASVNNLAKLVHVMCVP